MVEESGPALQDLRLSDESANSHDELPTRPFPYLSLAFAPWCMFLVVFPLMAFLWTHDPYTSNIQDYNKYKYELSPSQIHVINVDSTLLAAPEGGLICEGICVEVGAKDR